MIDRQDRKLVIRLKEDDGVAFEKLFLKYNQKLFNYCYRLLRSKQEAEGIVQATFMKIWELRHELNEEQSFSGLIFKISRNRVFNEFRSRLNQRYYYEYLKEYAETLDNTTEKELDFLEIKAMIDSLLRQLPERRREIFLLSRDQGLSYKEIAKKLEISENTVDTQIRKALTHFREMFRESIKPTVHL